ncbi:MAG: hypothetical protein WC484_08620 [Candidatus Omnitrophota bacterium]
MNLTQQEIAVIKKYLTAQIALDNHLSKATIGYNPKYTCAVEKAIEELKTVFTQDEIDFLTSAAYRKELMAQFM